MITLDARALRELVVDAVREAIGSAPQADDYMSVAAASKVASVSPAWLRAQQDAGKLGLYHAGRERRIKRGELVALLSAEPVDDSPEALARKASR